MEELSRMTLEEIAKAIGISRTTIYKVLQGKGNVSEETQKIVREALDRYHYVQNRNARNLARNRQYTIGYVGFQSKSAAYFSTEIKKGLERAAKEFGDAGLHIMISEFDVENPTRQLTAVEEMLEQGVESFVLAYSSEAVILQILKKLEERKCRIVLLSRDVKDHMGSYYVGVDYYRSGALAAELLTGMLPEGGKVFIPVTGEYRTNQDIHQRLQGFLDKLEQLPAIGLLPVAYDLTDGQEIAEQIALQMREEKELKGIFDLTYRLDVIADVLRSAGRKDIRLVGFDLFEEIRRSIEDGTVDAVVYQDLSQQAYFAVKLLFDELCYGRHRKKKKRYSKLEIIMKENLIYF